MLSNLIKALQILNKYGNPDYPTHCEHDKMYVIISPSKVSDEDLDTLESLGFFPEDDESFASFKYGSA